jgi:N-acetylglucosaminyldiphosphoundecaprenol N-acetyl-beta-D-mannosaminyltransferase
MIDNYPFEIDEKSLKFRVLGVPINIVTLPSAVDYCEMWAKSGVPKMVFVRETASLMAARAEPRLKALHEVADLVVPDGMPLVWIGRIRRHGAALGRVSGADLVDLLCERSVASGQTHFFYGGKPGVAEKMSARLQARFPGLKVVGTYCPPMREVGPDFEITDAILEEFEIIRRSGADFIWVGISSPKQEYLMNKARETFSRGVFLGVGAAFDFHSGAVKRAPVWMQRVGLEWLHRLLSEPRRLWRRYLILAPWFVFLAAVDEFRTSFNRR